VWRCALEVLRLLSPQLLQLHGAEACLQLLHGAAEGGGTAAVSERSLFASMAEHEEVTLHPTPYTLYPIPYTLTLTLYPIPYTLYPNPTPNPNQGVAEWIGDFQQRLPMPTAETGVAYDLYTNSHLCPREGVSADDGAELPADGRLATGGDGADGARRKPQPDADGGEGKRAAGRRRPSLTAAPDGKAEECVLL